MSVENDKRAGPFNDTRRQHGSEKAEDYTELIFELIEEKGEARTGEVAARLGVSHVTALRTIKRLQEQGYVKTERQKPITLTASGRSLAMTTIKKHRLLVDFFVTLGVPLKVAESDVEGLEHHISRVTLRCIQRYMTKLRQS